jgi:predicted nucleic-acid-binding Zn-ribbon protein
MGFIEEEIEKLKIIKECQERILRESNDPFEKESAQKALLALHEELTPLQEFKKNVEEKGIHFRNEEEEREFFNLVTEKGFTESVCTNCGYIGWPEIKVPKSYLLNELTEFIVGFVSLLITAIIMVLEDIENFWAGFLIFILVGFGIEFLFLRPILNAWWKEKTQIICPACKYQTMIPTDTPRGKELVEKQLLKTKKEKNSLDN